MKKSSIVVPALLQLAFGTLCSTTTTQADDAIAFDYKTGIVGSYWSSTRQGGTDFKNRLEAKSAALLNARNRGALAPIIVWDSNLTGYFAIAVGINYQNEYRIAVAQGSTNAEAVTRAIHILLRFEDMKRSSVSYQYFSYGSK